MKNYRLIHQYEIDTQEELASRLNEAGFKVTQATVSRDIRALKLTKVAGRMENPDMPLLIMIPEAGGKIYKGIGRHAAFH